MFRVSKQDNGRNLSLGGTVLRAAGLVAALTALAACQNRDAVKYAPRNLSVEQRYPIILAEQPVTLDVPVNSAGHAMSSSQRARVAGFLRAYRENASGPLIVRAPSGTRNELAALNTVEDIRAIMAEVDVPQGALRFRPYGPGRAHGGASVLLSFTGVKATAAECGDWSVNVGKNRQNVPYPNFGCASQRNLAAMIANPRDLEDPREMDAAPTERRQTVRDKYIQGEPTASKVDDEEKGTVAKVGK